VDKGRKIAKKGNRAETGRRVFGFGRDVQTRPAAWQLNTRSTRREAEQQLEKHVNIQIFLSDNHSVVL
jgi:hypothetical protein